MTKDCSRVFLRHPTDIPVLFTIEQESPPFVCHLTDVSQGGLAFHTRKPIAPGSSITIDIPFIEDGKLTGGHVVWCLGENNSYLIGVQFFDSDALFRARMVQQICHIEHYRRKIARDEGRHLNSEEAAREWISNHAADFPPK